MLKFSFLWKEMNVFSFKISNDDERYYIKIAKEENIVKCIVGFLMKEKSMDISEILLKEIRSEPLCYGCRFEKPGQKDHMGENGCLKQ